MHRTTLGLVLPVVSLLAMTAWGQWKPAAGPLMTRWAKDVTPGDVHKEYPRPQMVRKDWLNLNGLWQLAIAGKDEAARLGQDLPERILVPFPVESALSGVMKRAERVMYRRTFEIPEAWRGKGVLLHFGAVDWDATVYVNAKKVGTHRGGYDAFSFDITGALRPSGPQEIVVDVLDPTDGGDQARGKQVRNPKGIWYTPTTGIWQTVWLEPVPVSHIDSLRIVPNIDRDLVEVTVRYRQGEAGEQTVRVVVRDGSDTVAEGVVTVKARSKGTSGPSDAPDELAEPTVKLGIPRPKLWSPDSPFLYDLDVTLTDGGKTVDQVASYFGMRKIEVGKDRNGVNRLKLNGKDLFHIGPLDQGFWPDGLYTAPTDEALRYDVEVTKELGFNATRKHVKIEPDRWYYWCDKLGLMVWQDMPSGNNRTPESRDQFEKELRGLIEGRFNHPSIIMWVVFNEGWGQHDTEHYTRWVKELDPTRLVNNASGWTDRKVGDVMDIHSYPGPASPEPEPRRAAVLGEFGGLGLAVQGHTWTEHTWGYRGTESSAELTRKYVDLLRRVWAFKDSPGLSAAIYTQITDVETECNGLLTYDRARIKVDLEKVSAANRGDVPPPPEIREVVQTARKKPLQWRYMLRSPGGAWFRPDYNDTDWKEGAAGFGREGTPGAVIRTAWHTPDIWLRREFTFRQGKSSDLHLLVHHDEDVKVYINGVLALEAKGYTTDYELYPLKPEAKEALRPGKNLFAVTCHQTGGGQYIDVGIVDVIEKPTPKKRF